MKPEIRRRAMHAEGDPYWVIALDCGVSDAAVGRAVARMKAMVAASSRVFIALSTPPLIGTP